MPQVVITDTKVSSTGKTAFTAAKPSTATLVLAGNTPVFVTGPKGDKGDPGQGLQGVPGIQGLPGAVVVGTGDLNFDHFQAMASAVWVIPHGLKKYPSVTVIDSSGSDCEGSIAYDSLTQITVTFSAAFGGHAYLN